MAKTLLRAHFKGGIRDLTSLLVSPFFYSTAFSASSPSISFLFSMCSFMWNKAP